MERFLVQLTSCIAVMVALTLFGFVSSAFPYLVYMVDTQNNVVRVYDTGKNILSDHIKVGQLPQSITFTPDGKTAYVANLKSKSVTAIQTVDNKVVADIPIGSPASKIAISPDGKKAYVTSPNGSVFVIDTLRNLVIARFLIEGYGEEFGGYGSCLAVTPDGRKVYFCELRSVAIFDIAENRIVKRITLRMVGPRKIALSLDGKWAYFICTPDGSIEVLDTQTDTITNSYSGGVGCPWDVAAIPDDTGIYVASTLVGAITKNWRGAVLTVYPRESSISDKIFLAPRTYGFAISPDNSTIFVAHSTEHEVSEINLRNYEVKTIPGAYANALAIMPAPQLTATLTKVQLHDPLSKIPLTQLGPSQIDLAEMSNYAYKIEKTGELPAPIDGYMFIKPFSGSNGFAACAFQKDDQIVIAFRGTDLTKNLGLLSGTWLEGFNLLEEPLSIALEKTNRGNIFADASWILPGVDLTKTLQSYVEQAADFLLDINRKYSPAKITLTGHSLGGAIAQILGARTDLPTVAFNAPGVGAQVHRLEGNRMYRELDRIPFDNKGDNINLRMYGDPVSECGDHIGKVLTVYPLSENYKEKLFLAPFYFHDLEYMILQLRNQSPKILGMVPLAPYPIGDQDTPKSPFQ